MVPRNINDIVGLLIEVALRSPVNEMEGSFKKVLMFSLPFCFKCGNLTEGPSVCPACVSKHLNLEDK